MSNTPNIDEKLLTVSEVASRLDVAVKTVHRWLEKGLFPNARPKSPVPGSPYRIPEADVVEFEKQRDTALNQSKK